ncbi:hypothetical protein [Tropicimonas isoalkanivorans]|uniref:MORN repeat variant n=1 Tax=Tropicimonas isoalkanivorans TaxID=441112 RepID=A0A1I1NKL4_9RHOB|nr:hypothetical protein [Tropicimonas isoalkanivorans]SFC98191.1 hypothetical protein SAMN04488094_112124 [Tropicimonas isoalkanivorans]
MPLRTLLGSLLLLLPMAAAAAEEPLTAEQFDARTQGRTLYFYSGGAAYGAERYHGNRQVTWTFLDGQCKEGHWYQDGQFICFVYDDLPDPQCWTFFDTGSRLRALFEDREGATELYEAGETEEPLACVGPEVGV